MNKPDSQKISCTPGYKLLGDFWTLRVINVLREEERRFSEIERDLGDCNTSTLSNRLAKLHSDGIINRNELSRADVTYSLTDLGKLILPVLAAMDKFTAQFDKIRRQNTDK